MKRGLSSVRGGGVSRWVAGRGWRMGGEEGPHAKPPSRQGERRAESDRADQKRPGCDSGTRKKDDTAVFGTNDPTSGKMALLGGPRFAAASRKVWLRLFACRYFRLTASVCGSQTRLASPVSQTWLSSRQTSLGITELWRRRILASVVWKWEQGGCATDETNAARRSPSTSRTATDGWGSRPHLAAGESPAASGTATDGWDSRPYLGTQRLSSASRTHQFHRAETAAKRTGRRFAATDCHVCLDAPPQ